MTSFSEPFQRFAELFARATGELSRECFPDPNTMSLATVAADGRPSNRIVLLKAFDERGFVFYTNYEGRKGRELLANPYCALCFHWPPMEIQIRIEGRAEPTSDAEADAYFASRARASQLGAWASDQSRPMTQPGDLERRVAEVAARFEGSSVPRPPHWSGFRVVPDRMEFWRNRASRLHDRNVYEREGDGWRVTALYP
ncbi:MAG TPA: pyridoxamine 5'-phosphate oxidase [Gemmatimonadaceae bacterium]|nr:pyridoxamine 5'-phosphate oxidase [Gemmatimonadaceae bacterium]